MITKYLRPRRAFMCALLLCTSVLLTYRAFWIHILNRLRYSVKSTKSFLYAPLQLIELPFESYSVSKASAKHRQDPQFEPNLISFLNITINQYTQWHREQRRLCENNPIHARSIPLLVYNAVKGGIGDRIRGILYTYLVAVASNRLFLIDWQDPVPRDNVIPNSLQNNFTHDPDLFIGDEEVQEQHIMKNDSKYRNLDQYMVSTRVIIQRSPTPFRFGFFRDLYERYPELELTRKIVKAGLTQFHLGRDDIAPFILQVLFRTSPSFRLSLRNLLPFRGRRYLSVHARLGHGVMEGDIKRFNLSEHQLTLPSTAQCIGRLAAVKAHQHGLRHIFVATDTENAKNDIENGIHQVLPNALVEQSSINATHIFSHSAKRMFREQNQKHQKFEESFLDLGLLSMGESLVFFNSGFANGAMWFGAITDGVELFFRDCVKIQNGKDRTLELLQERRPMHFKGLIGNFSELVWGFNNETEQTH